MTDAEPCKHDLEYAEFPLPYWHWPRFAGASCPDCEREERAAWVESVRVRLTTGLEAAEAGEPFDWDAPESVPGAPRFALVRLNDRIDLALTVDEHGRCTAPAAGWYDFGRVRDEAAAESDERILAYLRHGMLTPTEAKAAYSQPMEFPFDTGPLFPEAMGAVLHGFLNAEPQTGPPYVHTFADPEQVQDEDGEWYVPIVPTYTLTTDPEGCGDPEPPPAQDSTALVAQIRQEARGFASEAMLRDLLYGSPGVNGKLGYILPPETPGEPFWTALVNGPPKPTEAPGSEGATTDLFDALGGVVPGAPRPAWGGSSPVLDWRLRTDEAVNGPLGRAQWAPATCICPWPWPMDDEHVRLDCPHRREPAKPVVGRNPQIGCRKVDGTTIHGRPHDCPKWMRG